MKDQMMMTTIIFPKCCRMDWKFKNERKQVATLRSKGIQETKTSKGLSSFALCTHHVGIYYLARKAK